MKEKIILANFAKRLTELINEHNNIPLLLKHLGLQSKSTIYRYMNAEMTPKLTTIKAIAEFYNVNPTWLMGFDVPKKSIINRHSSSAIVFVYGTIPAGIPMEMIDDIIGTEEISVDMLNGDKQYFGLEIKGHSMEPDYHDGDIIILLKQDNCENGEDCVVTINGNEATFKRVFKNENGITIQPLNTSRDSEGKLIYEPVSYTNEQIEKMPIKILGVFEELRRKKKRK